MNSSFASAISRATVEIMDSDPSVVILGIGPDYSSGIFGTTSEAFKKFGTSRVIDTPAMENGLSGIALGASMFGIKPILVHARNDFMFLALDQMLNAIAKWRYMFDGNNTQGPIVVRAVVGRGWGQGATHSQNLASTIAHYPGIKVVMPAFPADAGGMLISALNGQNPVVIIEHRNLFEIEGPIESPTVAVPLSGAQIINEGEDITIVTYSICTLETMMLTESFSQLGVSVEVIDLRTITPIDISMIINSVNKTKKLFVVEPDWTTFSVGSEICAQIKELTDLEFSFSRLGHAPSPAPVSKKLESLFYTSPERIFKTVLKVLNIKKSSINIQIRDSTNYFKGPY